MAAFEDEEVPLNDAKRRAIKTHDYWKPISEHEHRSRGKPVDCAEELVRKVCGRGTTALRLASRQVRGRFEATDVRIIEQTKDAFVEAYRAERDAGAPSTGFRQARIEVFRGVGFAVDSDAQRILEGLDFWGDTRGAKRMARGTPEAVASRLVDELSTWALNRMRGRLQDPESFETKIARHPELVRLCAGDHDVDHTVANLGPCWFAVHEGFEFDDGTLASVLNGFSQDAARRREESLRKGEPVGSRPLPTCRQVCLACHDQKDGDEFMAMDAAWVHRSCLGAAATVCERCEATGHIRTMCGMAQCLRGGGVREPQCLGDGQSLSRPVRWGSMNGVVFAGSCRVESTGGRCRGSSGLDSSLALGQLIGYPKTPTER